MVAEAETRRFRRAHVREARLEVAGTRRQLREERQGEAAEVEPHLHERAASGRYAAFVARPGSRLGTFELLEVVGRTSSGSRVWRVRCDCGELSVRIGPTLTAAARRGAEPTCPSCSAERRVAFRDFRRDVYREAWRRQWVDYGTLWTKGQTARLMGDVREDLERELGEVEDPAPSLRMGRLELAAEYHAEILTEEERDGIYEPLGDLDDIVPGLVADDEVRRTKAWKRLTREEIDAELARPAVEQRRKVEAALVRSYEERVVAATAPVPVWKEEERPRPTADRGDASSVHSFFSSMTREFEAKERQRAEEGAWDEAWNDGTGSDWLARCGFCQVRMRWDGARFPFAPPAGSIVPCRMCLTVNRVASSYRCRIQLVADRTSFGGGG